MKKNINVAILALVLAALPVTVRAFVITFDYTYDTTGFFGNTTAKAALEAAASDISDVLRGSALGALQSSYTGTAGTGAVALKWEASLKNPATGEKLSLLPPLTANAFTIYVGARSLSGNTLGQGGPAGISYRTGGSADTQEDLDAATAAAKVVASAGFARGGPIIGSANGISYGTLAGNLWFDNDASTAWHFDHTTAVESASNDFYSVALHEILHTLGYGIGETWNSLKTGNTWSGEAATGTSIDGGHLASGTQSQIITGSVLQDAVMTPSINIGTRKYLTELDLAILSDLGYTVMHPAAAVPELATVALMAGLAALLAGAARLARRQPRSRS
ncbi:MAG: hypothetical protein LBK99_06130 [Opitutaceae bacterium]|nr:hypothetical protein [Opitutaceae bacterium]